MVKRYRPQPFTQAPAPKLKAGKEAAKSGIATRDTFVNFAAQTGIGTNNLSSANTYGFNPVSRNRLLIEWMYRGSWICGNAVDCVADDMTREGIEFSSTMDPKAGEQLQSAIRRRQLWQSLNQVVKWARLYGGAVAFIDIDGQDPSTPLRIETVKKDQFKGLITMDRWMLNPDPTKAVEDADPAFGLPAYYQTVAQSFSFPFPNWRIHYTRLLRMEGIELPYWQKITENMWGISILERIYDRLTAFDSTTQGAAQLAFKAYLRTYKIKDLRQIIAAGGQAMEALTQQIDLTRLYQSNEGLTLMDTNDEFEGHAYSFGGLADIMDRMAEQIAGATQIPLARLLGQSPGGMNSTGDHELRTYYDSIKRQQERWFRHPVDVILRVIAASEGIKLPEGFEYDFTSLWQMTDEEKSTIDVNDVNAVAEAQSAGLISDQTALKELRQRGRTTGRWSNITDKDINAAEDTIPDPMELMQQGGPGGAAPKPGGAKPETEKDASRIGEPTGDSARVLDVGGLPIFIESPKGTYRTGGKGLHAWKTLMPASYGYIEGVGSAEGAFEQLDCYVGDDLPFGQVYVINQKHLHGPLAGQFDEHKCMLQFSDQGKALETYARSFSDGRGADRILSVVSMPLHAFKDWMKKADLSQPIQALKSVA